MVAIFAALLPVVWGVFLLTRKNWPNGHRIGQWVATLLLSAFIVHLAPAPEWPPWGKGAENSSDLTWTWSDNARREWEDITLMAATPRLRREIRESTWDAAQKEYAERLARPTPHTLPELWLAASIVTIMTNYARVLSVADAPTPVGVAAHGGYHCAECQRTMLRVAKEFDACNDGWAMAEEKGAAVKERYRKEALAFIEKYRAEFTRLDFEYPCGVEVSVK